MNDRAVALLEQYDIEVIRTRKGRGAILCDTTQGVLLFKEYAGNEARLLMLHQILQHIKEQGLVQTDELIPTKEGSFSVKDRDGVCYILKTCYEGRECNIYDKEECLTAMRLLAKLHKSMTGLVWEGLHEDPVPAPGKKPAVEGAEADYPEAGGRSLTEEEPFCPESGTAGKKVLQNETLSEFEKRNKELLRIRSFLRKKGQKQVFERRLLGVMDRYIAQAKETTEDFKKYVQDLQPENESCNTYYHGDYQYHNIIFCDRDWHIINFEKCQRGSQTKDIYLLLRKLLEKSSWSVSLGRDLLDAYQQILPLNAVSYIELYYRLAYPEKFWKIANFYYNSRKAWIPERNMEKLEKLLDQEKERKQFLESIFSVGAN